MQHVVIPSRDGLDLHSYMTLPKDAQKDLPFVLLVHGGPHGVRDRISFDEEAQLLSSRGFGVLQVNFRGSGGYGKTFMSSGYREWGAKMQDDLTDATHWLIEQGYANKNRICIMGASYGGFAALSGVTKEPDLYQ